MPSVSETIVREYFELRGFLLRQQRKYAARGLRDEEEIDFFVLNPHPLGGAAPLPFILASADVPRLERAVVAVKPWHTAAFTAARLAQEPDIVRFVTPANLRQAARFFGGAGTVTKVLVVPSLPHEAGPRQQSLDFLREKGVDAVLLFRSLLAELVAALEPTRSYEKSDLLQVIRLLKHYEFFKEPQLELFKSRRPRAPRKTPQTAAGGPSPAPPSQAASAAPESAAAPAAAAPPAEEPPG